MIWSSKKADTEFSKFIRQRDNKCIRCGRTEHLQCSHFFARANSATRYDPENCDTLCYACHYGNRSYGWEYNKQSDYRDFKLKQLGDRYSLLEARAKSIVQRSDAIISLMNLLGVAETPKKWLKIKVKKRLKKLSPVKLKKVGKGLAS